MCRLDGVGRRDVRYIRDLDVDLRKLRLHVFALLLSSFDGLGRVPEDMRALHLMKRRVVRRVDLVASVHVRCKQPLLLPLRKDFNFVSRGMCAEHQVFVDVIRVCF